MAGNNPSGSAPERVYSSVWQMPVALISTITSPAFGPSRLTVVTTSGLPVSNATAARTSIWVLRSLQRLLLERQHDLRLRDDGGELAVAAGDVGLHHDGGAADMQRRRHRARSIALGDRREEIGLALDRGGSVAVGEGGQSGHAAHGGRPDS